MKLLLDTGTKMIHMIALLTVIGRLIFSLYPECNKNTRPLCRKDRLRKRKRRKISDIFIKHYSLQSEEESTPSVKKQCLEEDERHPPKHGSKS